MGVSAVMCEAEKVECPRPRTTSPGPFFSEPSELHQSRLCCFQLQMKLSQSFSHCLEEPFGILAMLEARQKVIRIAKVIGSSPARALEPSLKPQVKRVMQVHIGQQW